MSRKEIKFIDLFAGLGGIRLGFQEALANNHLHGRCVFASEIKSHAIKVYQDNFPGEPLAGDITQIPTQDIPDFDVLLAGFPCQAFSSAGRQRGFEDARGTLFFEVARILRDKQPVAFLLENVEGLVRHDKGRTLKTILDILESLNYHVTWRVLDASLYGVPQRRRRIYLVGTKSKLVNLDNLPEQTTVLQDVLEWPAANEYFINSPLSRRLLAHYSPQDLSGKQIRNKRGGSNNIHSWNIDLRGETSPEQRYILEELVRQSRQKKWAILKGIPWSESMPLTVEEIATFYPGDKNALPTLLNDLVTKGYLKLAFPTKAPPGYCQLGYKVIGGRLSFDINNILDPKSQVPTIVATDASRMAVVDGNRLRRLTIREGLRLFGFPDSYRLEGLSYTRAFDLLGNSVCVNVIRLVADRLIQTLDEMI